MCGERFASGETRIRGLTWEDAVRKMTGLPASTIGDSSPEDAAADGRRADQPSCSIVFIAMKSR